MSSSTYSMEAGEQIDRLDDATCSAELDSPANSFPQGDIYSNEVMYQSEREECLQYEMPFMHVPSPIMWHSMEVRKVPGTVRDNGVTSFSFHKCNELLRSLTLSVTMPRVSLKKEFANRPIVLEWNSFLPHNLVKRSVLKVGDSVIEDMDSDKMDFSAFMSTDGTLTTEFTPVQRVTCLNPFVLNTLQAWHYSLESNRGYPLFSLGEDCSLDHDYLFELDPIRLIKMQVFDEEAKKWTHIDPARHRHLLDVPSDIRVEAFSESISLLPVEVKSMIELYHSNVSVALVVQCPSSPVSKEADDAKEDGRPEFTVKVDHDRVLTLAWGVKDVAKKEKFNVHSLYSGEDHQELTPIESSHLTLERDGKRVTKFDLPAVITCNVIPSHQHRLKTNWSGLHMYHFTKLQSTGCCTSNFSELNAELRIKMCAGLEMVSSLATSTCIEPARMDGSSICDDRSDREPDAEKADLKISECDGPPAKKQRLLSEDANNDGVNRCTNTCVTYSPRCYALVLKNYVMEKASTNRSFLTFK